MLLSKCCGLGQSLDSKKNIDVSALPPQRVCFQEHIKRVNYEVGIWKRAHIPKPEVPHPAGDHGWTLSKGRLKPRWFKGTALPANLADILEKAEEDRTPEDSDSIDDDYNSGSCDSDSDYSDTD